MINNDEIYDDDILNYDNSNEFEGLGDDDYLPEGIDADFEVDEEDYYSADDEYEAFDDDEEQPDNDGEFAGTGDDDFIDYEDLDFSNIAGKDFKGSFKKLNKQVERSKIKKVSVPAGRPVIVEGMKRPKQRVVTKREIIRRKVVERPVSNKKPIQQRPAEKRPVQQQRPTEKLIQRPTKQVQKSKLVKRTALKRPVLTKKQLAKRTEIGVKTEAKLLGPKGKKISKILVPSDKKVIVEGVSKFILSRSPQDEAAKQIGYYKGKKLKELILIIDNDSPNTFVVDLFNPSMPLDYLYNTSQNLNNKISVANSSGVSYSDVLFNLLANPTMIMNAVFVFGGPTANIQQAKALRFVNKDMTGTQEVTPVNIALQIDTMQVFGSTVNFHIKDTLGRAFIPDGMETIRYEVLPGNKITMAFFYRQKSLKKFFYKDATEPKKII